MVRGLGFFLVTIVHTRDATQPTPAHPASRSKMRIVADLLVCLMVAIIVGKKYIGEKKMRVGIISYSPKRNGIIDLSLNKQYSLH